MLVLSRRPGDAILIDGGIRIVVLSCDHRGVRIGIEAPAQIGIVREEIAGQTGGPDRNTASVAAARAWLSKGRRAAPGQDTESSRTS